MKRKIFLFSGGLDSMGALLKLVADPIEQKENIRLFHMEYVNQPFALPQKQAVRSALVHCPNWDLYVYRNEGADLKEPLEVCLKAMLTFGSGNFREGDMLGETPTELELIVGYELEEQDTTTISELNEAVQLIRQAYIKTGIGILPTSVVSPVSNMNKREIADLIGEQRFWSCRSPIGSAGKFEPCGSCSNCKQLEKYLVSHPTIHVDYSLVCEKAFGI